MPHTLGPWKFDGTRDMTGYEITAQIDGVFVPVAYTQGTDKANAELIADAPSILEALHWAIGQLEMLGFDPTEPTVKAAMDSARNLIVKHWPETTEQDIERRR
jgi:hypothetical protein